MFSAQAAAYDGSVFVLAGVTVSHNNPNDRYVSGTVELLQLLGERWVQVPLLKGAPYSQLTLTELNGAMLATGSSCPGDDVCTQEDGAAALIRPSTQTVVTSLTPAGSEAYTPYPYDIAGGAGTVVITYPNGLESLGRTALHNGWVGRTLINDVGTGSWLCGPTMPKSQESVGTYWTPYGVVSLGSAVAGGAGWLLRPGS